MFRIPTVLALSAISFCYSLFSSTAFAQTDIKISGAQAGFPVAIPIFCNKGGADVEAKSLSDQITKDLKITGIFKLIDRSSYVENAGKCDTPETLGYSDWSVIGAEGLVKAEIIDNGSQIEAKLFLYDVQQKKAVVGKKYEASKNDASKIAHRFANEIVKFFTGEPGVFGTNLAYISKVGRFKELFVMGMDGSGSRQITKDIGLALSPSWSPKADKIVYTSYRSRKPELYTISPDGSGLRQLGERQGLEIGAKFSSAGGFLTAASINGVSKIVRLDGEGRLMEKLTDGDSIDVSPSASPDGGRIAFCSNRGGGPQIYSMSASGGGVKRISFTNSNYCTSPAWSPKGDKIAFICRSGGNQLFVAGVEGQSPQQLTYAGDNEDPSWAPDSRMIAYSTTSSGRGRSVAIVSLISGVSTRISPEGRDDSQPSWSQVVD